MKGPAEVTAGDPAVLSVSAAGAAGAPLHPLGGEKLEIRLADPPVLVLVRELPAGMEGAAEVSLRLRKAGKTEFRVLARRCGAVGTLPVVVRPGPAAAVFLRIASNSPVGEPFDVAAEVQDDFGNPVPDWTGTLSLAAPEDPKAELPGPVEVRAGDRGRGVFRGVAFGTPGYQVLSVSDGGSLQGRDDTMAEATTIRRWFVAGPFDAGGKDPFDPAVVPGADGTRRPGDGTVLGDRVFAFRESGQPLVDAGKAKGALLAVAYVSSAAGTDAVLHLGHGGRVKAWLAGKPVYEGPAAPEAAVERGTVPVRIPEGPAALVLRVEVRGEGQDGFAARFALPDGGPVPGLRILAARPFPAETLSLSGTVKDAKGPVAVVDVRLAGAKSLRTRTDARGWYGFADLKPGSYRVTPSARGRKADPESRTVDLKDTDAQGVDFNLK